MTTDETMTEARLRAHRLVDEGVRLLARGAGHDELLNWDVRQHGLWRVLRPVDPALATRLRSLKLRAGVVIRAHYRTPAAARPRLPRALPRHESPAARRAVTGS
jgi:hypothetical protein